MVNHKIPQGTGLFNLFSYRDLYLALCAVYVSGLLAFALLMFETREELILVYLPFSLVILLLNPDGKIRLWAGKTARKTLLLALIGLLAAAMIYFRSQYQALLYERLGNYAAADYFFSVILIVLVFILTWVEYGASIPVLALVALFYAYRGDYFPGFFYHQEISVTRIIAMTATEFSSGDGVLGELPQIGITWVAIFTIFAGLAFSLGVLDYIMKITYQIFTRFRYGVPQIAVISSMVFGMFSGSGAANVAGTGSFTIPLMKRYGIPPHIAGAVESVASSGGQIMPPVMGAAAFVMASYLGKYYWEIMVIGFLPALIFYGCVALAVYLYSRQYLAISSGAQEQVPMGRLRKIDLLDGLPVFVAIAVLMVAMSVFWMEVMLAGFFMIVSYLITWLAWQALRLPDKKAFWGTFSKKLLNGLRAGAESTASIANMLACIGIVVAVLIQTGLAQKLSFGIVALAGGNKAFLVLLTGGLCVIFGMVASTVAAYILTVTLAAPVLLKMGVPLLVTHFSVFYFAMLGLITPPVAPCCAVASGIAKGSFLKICWYAIKIGLPLLVLPLTFFLHPGIIIHGAGTIPAIFIIGLGMAGLTLGFNLQYTGLQSLAKRVLYTGVGALTLFYPNPTVSFLGIPLCALILGFEVYRLRRVPELPLAAVEE